MTFDNGKTVIALRLRVFLATVLLLVYVYFAFLGKELKFPFAGLSASAWTAILLGLYALISFYPMLLSYKYIYFSDDGSQVIFRFYSVGIIKGKRSSIEIPKSEFGGYTIESYSGFLKLIKLSRKMDRKVVEYPPIYLGALSRKEIDKLRSALDELRVLK